MPRNTPQRSGLDRQAFLTMTRLTVTRQNDLSAAGRNHRFKKTVEAYLQGVVVASLSTRGQGAGWQYWY